MFQDMKMRMSQLATKPYVANAGPSHFFSLVGVSMFYALIGFTEYWQQVKRRMS